jgi:hypothetical protein
MILTYEEFAERFEPKKNQFVADAPYDECMFETYGDELIYIQGIWKKRPHYVWTIISADDGAAWIVPGYHFVNREGYLITQQPCNTDVQVDMDL